MICAELLEKMYIVVLTLQAGVAKCGTTDLFMRLHFHQEVRFETQFIYAIEVTTTGSCSNLNIFVFIYSMFLYVAAKY